MMEKKSSRVLYIVLFFLGWIGILWSVWTFCINAYNRSTSIFLEDPSLFILLCVSFMSIATAFILEQTSRSEK